MRMPRRAASPAASENEVDIGSSLFTNHAQPQDTSDEDGGPGEPGETAMDNLDVMADESSNDDEAIIAKQLAASNRKGTNLKGRTVKKGGGFQAMGLNANLLKAITRKGFSVPTPIQRKTIPLLLNEKDVVGMARTGSGKTAAFVIPMIEKLKTHSPKVGSRALILSPSRELALQTLQVVKELGRGTDLRSILLVGGDSLEEQFSAMASNPDIVIATPGRFLHLKVEMNLDLSSVRYVVFDEADRLFEMGFAAQLTEILHALPSARQTLLFSATLPKSLVEFARAGLQEPNLIRLDADSKISPDLQSAFFSVKSSEKEGALLHILEDVIGLPTGSQLVSTVSDMNGKKGSKKRKRTETEGNALEGPQQHSTIVFAATKHHVEYLAHLLKAAGYAVSYVYGALDQTARKEQVQSFRNGQSNILVVTDVAARGIDIPILANVINYDFPSQPKIYVHRVGRTARAGQKGWSYSLVRDADAPYLLDLQLFLGRKLVVGRVSSQQFTLATDVVVGSQRRDAVQTHSEWVTKTLQTDVDLYALRSVAAKGEKLYMRTRNSASSESAKRAKTLVGSDGWTELHAMFGGEDDDMEAKRQVMLARVGGFRPQESIFEIGARRGGRKNNEEAVDAIRTIRGGLERKKQKSSATEGLGGATAADGEGEEPENDDGSVVGLDDMSMASDSELEVTFTGATSSKSNQNGKPEGTADSFRNSEFFMSYNPEGEDLEEEKAYGVHSGSNSNFVEAARGATMDLAGDEGSKGFGEARGVMRWDKRHKKYVARTNDEDGSKGKKLVRGESGAKIAASFRSGRYDAWKKANRITKAPRVGDKEKESAAGAGHGNLRAGNKKFMHSKVQKPKAADKFRDDYEKQKQKYSAAKEREVAGRGDKRELHSVDDIRKARNLKEKRREKNARPSQKPGQKPGQKRRR